MTPPPPLEQYAQNNKQNPHSQPFLAHNTEMPEDLYAYPEMGGLPKTSYAD